MSEREKPLLEKWISAKFDGKIVVSADKIKKEGKEFVNFKLSIINGKEYTTKLGKAMSIQLDARDIDELIAALQQFDKYKTPEQISRASQPATKLPGDDDGNGDLS